MDDETASTELTPRQRQAVLLLAEGLPPSVVAHRLSGSRQTIYNWRHRNAAFRRAVAELQSAQYEAGRDSLCGLVEQAAATLSQVMGNSEARDGDRIAAARTVLQFGLPLRPGPQSDTPADDASASDLAEELLQALREADDGPR